MRNSSRQTIQTMLIIVRQLIEFNSLTPSASVVQEIITNAMDNEAAKACFMESRHVIKH